MLWGRDRADTYPAIVRDLPDDAPKPTRPDNDSYPASAHFYGPLVRVDLNIDGQQPKWFPACFVQSAPTGAKGGGGGGKKKKK